MVNTHFIERQGCHGSVLSGHQTRKVEAGAADRPARGQRQRQLQQGCHAWFARRHVVDLVRA
jgi:hypothetical protein